MYMKQQSVAGEKENGNGTVMRQEEREEPAAVAWGFHWWMVKVVDWKLGRTRLRWVDERGMRGVDV